MCVLWHLMTPGFCSVSLCAAYELLGDDGYKLTHTSKKKKTLKFPVTKLRHFNMCCAQIRTNIPVKKGLDFTRYKYIKLFNIILTGKMQKQRVQTVRDKYIHGSGITL